MNKYLEEKVALLGIGHGQIEYFKIIATHQNEIAKMKNVGKASVTNAINILENKGYIVRQVNEWIKIVLYRYGKSVY
ncbi:MAG: hypothetical protein FNP40_13505 [Dehalobacter sp. 4CP]|uniref:hypothetical protein n=1 Tax=Dehalobacter sp. CP TaxID=2594474 RepID=UPI0013CDA066|nr:hypothetical protein [Dehalobacter sp. 4CP]